MARKKLTPTTIVDNGTFYKIDSSTNGLAVSTADDEFEFVFDQRDDKYILFVSNASSTTDATLTVYKGDGVFGGANAVLTVKKGESGIFALDSGRHMFVSGTDKGKVIIKCSLATDVTLSVFTKQF